MKSFNLATMLSLIAFMPDGVGSGLAEGATTVDGDKIVLSKQDVDNVIELAKDENWTNEQVLSYAHGLVLGGYFPTVSEALQRGIDEFGKTTGDEGVAAMSATYGDSLADDGEDFIGDPDDMTANPELTTFLDELFSDEEDEDGGDDDDTNNAD